MNDPSPRFFPHPSRKTSSTTFLHRIGVFLMAALLLGSLGASFLTSWSEGERPRDYHHEQKVIDSNLKYHLENDNDDGFEVLVQFRDEVSERDLEKMRELDFKIYQEFDVIPMVFAFGSRDSIYRLADYERSFWLEYNAPMKYDMNLSTYTIQAQKVHEREIISPNSKEMLSPIDGTGVTVVVLDSGIDGAHPDLEYDPINIEFGEEPRPGQKLIYNAKKDQNATGQDDIVPWIPLEDTDTSSGHGTHCAGTIGGTGDASAGDVIGVAPGAWLIGLSMGELVATIDEFIGLKWVYDHSKPGDNPANIRVVSNSWGPGEPFDNLDPNDASIRMIENIVYENNVVVVFSAGNNGRGHHDGDADTVNIFGKVPGVISVAATTRDGKALSDFTSRGNKDKLETFPDIAAPGVGIWSAAATKTLIGAGVVGSNIIEEQGAANPYYLAISGTSMSCPHVAGLSALLWQACPSLKVSDVDEDFDGKLPFKIEDIEGDLYDIEKTKIHEVELILKLTADYINPTDDNLVPTDHHRGVKDRKFDFAQGYGLVNADRAVALALYLNHLRDPDGDGVAEHPGKTVYDAYGGYKKIMKNELPERQKTDVISTSWEGKFVDIDKSLQEESEFYGDTVPGAIQMHSVFVPETARKMEVTFTYFPYNLRIRAGPSIPTTAYVDLTLIFDADGDGKRDYPSGAIIPDPLPPFFPNPSRSHTKTFTIDFAGGWESYRGREWVFDVYGFAVSTSPNLLSAGVQSPYSVEMVISLVPDETTEIDYRFFEFEEPSEIYKGAQYGGTVSLPQYYYDLTAKSDDGDGDLAPVWFMSTIIILAVAVIALAHKLRIPDAEQE